MKTIYKIEVLTSPADLAAAALLAKTTLKKVYSFDTEEVEKNMKYHYPKTVFGVKNQYGELTATISIYQMSHRLSLPSEELFDHFTPQGFKTSKVIEIGRLCKSEVGTGNHLEMIALLKAIMQWSKEENIVYWTATVREELLFLLRKLGLPFDLIFKDKFEPYKAEHSHYGTYPDSSLFFISCLMEESYRVLEKIDLSQLKPKDI